MATQHPQAIPLSQEAQYLAGHLVPINSSACTHIAYKQDTVSIWIQYRDGEVWAYFPYSLNEAKSLWFAGSRGEWIWTYIRVRGPGNKHRHRRGSVQVR